MVNFVTSVYQMLVLGKENKLYIKIWERFIKAQIRVSKNVIMYEWRRLFNTNAYHVCFWLYH
jgi:hypothetical protein